MIVDVATVEATRILYVGDRQSSIDYGCSLGNSFALNIIAPPVEGRAFSRFALLQLQYLFWNTFHEKPSYDYSELLQNCMKRTLALKINA